MATNGPLITVVNEGLEIKGRRRLNTPAIFDSMLSDLSNRMTKQLEAGKTMVINDLDVSQNKLTREQFESLFMTLGVASTRVTRYRMFGCPTLNDEVVEMIANHFRTNLTADTAPAEMHLSDCAITTEGFHSLIGALEETDVFPKANPAAPSQGYPLYLRLENNYIDEAAIQEKVDAGVIKAFTKTGSRTVVVPGGAKVNLVVMREGGGFQQKSGEPPAPDSAPPPKQVWDKHAEAAQMQQWASWMGMGWGGKGGGWEKGGWEKGKGAAGKAALPAPAAAGKGSPAAAAKGAGKGAAPATVPPKPAAAPQQQSWQQNQQQQSWQQKPAQSWNNQQQQGWQNNQQQSWQNNQQQSWKNQNQNQNQQQSWQNNNQQQSWQNNQQQNWRSPQQQQPQNSSNQVWKQNSWQQGSSGSAADRSRTPANRNTKPVQVPPKKGLPHPWEEHHSDEYGIPYYWNSETGDSLWERKPEWGK